MSSSSFPFFRHKSLTIAQAFWFRKDFLDFGFSSCSDDVFERFPGKMNIGLYWRQFGVRKTILMQRSSEIQRPSTIWCYRCVIDVANALSMSSGSLHFFSTQKPGYIYSPGFSRKSRELSDWSFNRNDCVMSGITVEDFGERFYWERS